MRRRRTQQRERVPFRLPDGRTAELLRVADPRARRLRLLVNERGVRMTVPSGASKQQEQEFLTLHLPWLAEQLRDTPESAEHLLIPGHACKLPLRGDLVPVEWRDAHHLHMELADDRLFIGTPDSSANPALRQILREFYVAQARADLGRWLPAYLPGLPRAPRQWRIRPLSSLWGSLSSSDVMSLDLALILAPPPAFEYVVVHELCHLIHANHSPAFWHEVEQRLPQWRIQRRWLRDEGLALKRRLHRLVA